MTYIIGLTGGIGSGKTAVSDRFAQLGVTIVDADVVARRIVEPGSPALATIATHFGQDILLANGSLDRVKLRQKVFSDPAERAWLERLTHPLIQAEILSDLNRADSPYALLVSPLLLESTQRHLTQRTCVVDVPESVQLQRTMVRDNNSESQVKAIMAAQANREERLAMADDIIRNDGSLADLYQQVDQLHQKYLELAQHG